MIGILPAAGQATRIHGLPKFLLPIPQGYLLDWHIKGMEIGGWCERVVIGTSSVNRPLVTLYASKDTVRFTIDSATMSETVLATRGYCDQHNILFSMPDTYFTDGQAFAKLRRVLNDGADVAVGLFAAREGQRNGGMCRIDGNRVVEVVDKPASGDYPYIWGVLAWRPSFWDMLRADEPHVGYALPRAIEAGLDVRAVVCEGGYYDCGTVAGYFELIRHLTDEAVAA